MPIKHSWLAVLFLSALSFGQGVRFGDGQPTIQAGPVAGKTDVLRSLPRSIVSVCGPVANAVPCTNKVTTYTDSTLITACSTSVQLVLAGTTSCVGTSDSLGNWGVWLPSGQYTYTITDSKGNSTGPYSFTLATGNGGTNGVNTLASGVTYTFTPTDSGKLVLCQNSSAMSFMLPSASTLGQAWGVRVQNVGLGICTVTAALNNIDGAPGSTGVLLAPGQGATIEVDQSGTPQFWTMRGIGFMGTYTGTSTFNGDMTVVGNINISGQINNTGAGAWQFNGKKQAVNTCTVPPGFDFCQIVGTDGKFRQVNADGSPGTSVTVTLTSNYTNATTTLTNLSDGTNNMAFTVAASANYKLVCDLIETTTANTATPKMQITGPASPTAVNYGFQTSTSASAVYQQGANSFGTSLSTVAGGAITTLPGRITMNLANGATAGTVQVQMAASGAGTLTILAGSSCILTQ